MSESLAASDSAPDEALRWWRQKPVWIMLFLGFSAGIPIYLIFGSLSLWLREAGMERSTVTYFSWAVLGYSFKFIWAPLVDRLPLPWLTRLLGRRRAWMLVAQLAVMASIVMMGSTDPQQGLTMMAWGAVLLGFSSATQDIVIDAYRIEVADPKLQAMLASTYIAGYRTGMIVAGSVALLLAQYLGSTAENYSLSAWQNSYYCMALVMLVGVVTTLLISEPDHQEDAHEYQTSDYLGFFAVFVISIVMIIAVYSVTPNTPVVFEGFTQKLFSFVYGSLRLVVALFSGYAIARFCNRVGFVNSQMVYEGYQAPIQDFFKRYGKLALWILLLVGCYRISDIVLGVITNVFYQDMGYSKYQIATISKGFGVAVTISGSFLGGMMAIRFGVMRTLMIAAILVVLANLSFLWLANVEANTAYLIAVIVVDNLTQGLSMVAFIAWMSSLTNVSFTATQYAIFSSLMTLIPKLIGGLSGTIVDMIGYTYFFLFASALGLPVIALIYFLSSRIEVSDQTNIS